MRTLGIKHTPVLPGKLKAAVIHFNMMVNNKLSSIFIALASINFYYVLKYIFACCTMSIAMSHSNQVQSSGGRLMFVPNRSHNAGRNLKNASQLFSCFPVMEYNTTGIMGSL